MYPITDKLRECFMAGYPQVVAISHGTRTLTGTGTNVTFRNTIPAPVDKAEVYVTAVQNGSGTPSPTNIREIVTPVTNDTIVLRISTPEDFARRKATRSWKIPFPYANEFGIYNLLTGVFTVTHTIEQIDSVEEAVGDTFITTMFQGMIATPDSDADVLDGLLCDRAVATSYTAMATNEAVGISVSANGEVAVRLTADDTLDSLNEYLAEHPIQMLMPLAEPYTVTELPTYEIVPVGGDPTFWTGIGKVSMTVHIGEIYTEADVVQGSFIIDRSCLSGSALEVGTCMASEFDVSLMNDTGALDGKTFAGVEWFVQVGVRNEDGEVEGYIPMGYFTADGSPKVRDMVNITALDRMTKFDKVVTDAETIFNGTRSISGIISYCCTKCGVELATTITGMPNASYIPSAISSQKYTYRQLLSYCVGAMGKCAWINPEGLLEIGFAEALDIETSAIAGIAVAGVAIVGDNSGEGVINETFDESNRFSSEYEDYQITTSGVVCTVSERDSVGEVYEHEYVLGSDDYAFDLSDNPFVVQSPESMLENLTALVGITYTPVEIVSVPVPHLMPMDWILYQKNATSLYSIITSMTFTMNGNTGLRATGESPTVKNMANIDGVTAVATDAIQKLQYEGIVVGRNSSSYDVYSEMGWDSTWNQGLYVRSKSDTVMPERVSVYAQQGYPSLAGVVNVFTRSDNNDSTLLGYHRTQIGGEHIEQGWYDANLTYTRYCRFQLGKEFTVYRDNAYVSFNGADTIFRVLHGYMTVNSTRQSEYALTVGGNAYASGTWYGASDRKLKKDIESLDIDKTADFVYSLRAVEFSWKDSEGKHHGLIAQEVNPEDGWELVRDSVTIDEDGNEGEHTKSIAYTELIADLIATVQSQNERIKSLEERILALENKENNK